MRSIELVMWENGQLGATVTLINGDEHTRRVMVDGDNVELMSKLRNVAPWDGREPN